MNMTFIAHESKKDLLIRFCESYNSILKKHNIFSTEDTARLISDVTDCKVNAFLNGTRGGYQQIAARIACNEIDMVVFFRDALTDKNKEIMENNMWRLCDVHTVPIATNIATAELLILGMERGDLDWRLIMNMSDIYKLEQARTN